MPKIYKYLGIVIVLYPNDHAPIHYHAICNGASVAIFLYEKDGVVQTVRYQEKRGKFSTTEMNDLKAFVSKHKNALLFAYTQYKNGIKLKPIIITKRIK